MYADDERQFGFVRIVVGDEMSKRTKFVLITWIGANVSALKRAKVSTDKTVVKAVIQVIFAVSTQYCTRVWQTDGRVQTVSGQNATGLNATNSGICFSFL